MTRVFVVTFIDYYDDGHQEILGVTATMALGKAMAEKRLEDLGRHESNWPNWWEGSFGHSQRAHLDVARGMFRVTVVSYKVVDGKED